MSDIKIIDNLLDKDAFTSLQSFILGDDFAWHFNQYIDYANEEKDKFQFTHSFYKYNQPYSAHYDVLNPILATFRPATFALVRIKANLLTRTPKIVVNDYHVDHDKKNWNTSIFYVNTNDGYTEFEDGTIINSVANRLITFPSDMKHRGTSCTDEKTRVVINFNWV
jgi:hypothetical protein